ncbi:MAG: lipoyl(octanoyl) transferase LipB [Candidatus Hydrogenedentes bacterium]|nr:lipoyl(octanoyl) transferase LipB [Candidatus Hydrogenedentota bacterium]
MRSVISSGQRVIEIIRFDRRMPYSQVYALQLERRRAVERGDAGNALHIVEHEPVITLGRNFQSTSLLKTREHLAKIGVDVCEVDRGGDATYHGPGQLVAYPILNLNEWTPSIKWYLRTLEDVLIAVVAKYGLKGERLEGYTGVWVGGAKIAAIGIGLHNWVTFHGIALNVDPNMAHFGLIIPCGIVDKPVTSLKQLLPSPPSLGIVSQDFVECFSSTFDCAMA